MVVVDGLPQGRIFWLPRCSVEALRAKLCIDGWIDGTEDDGWFASEQASGTLWVWSARCESLSLVGFILVYLLDWMLFRNDLQACCSKGCRLCGSVVLVGLQHKGAAPFFSGGGSDCTTCAVACGFIPRCR